MNAYTMINILKLDKRDFLVSKVIFTLTLKTFSYMTLLMLSSLFVSITMLETLIISGYILFAALIWEIFILKIFIKFKFDFYAKTGYVILSLLLLLTLCYLLPVRGVILNLRPILNNGYLFLLLLVLAIISIWRLYRFDNYSAVAKKTVSRERILEIEDLLKNMAFADVNLAEGKLASEKVTGTDNLRGYALLNHLFFTRHRRIITKPVRAKVIIVAILTLIFWGFLIWKPEFKDTVRGNILSLSPYLVFAMYMLSSGDKFSRALFFNCDRYMLKEHYYKDKEALLDNFTTRLKKSITLNLLPAGALAVMVFGTGVITGMDSELIRLLPMVATILTLSLFYSTHYLFIYYILQPYTVDLGRTGPLYSMVNSLVYLISFGSIYIKTTSMMFTFAVMFFTVLYTAAAILLTCNLAPRTFRLK